MQRLKKYLTNFCHDQQRWGGGQFLEFMGGHSCYEGGIELMGTPPVPPTRGTLDLIMVSLNDKGSKAYSLRTETRIDTTKHVTSNAMCNNFHMNLRF